MNYAELIAEVSERSGVEGVARRADRFTSMAEAQLNKLLRTSDMEVSATLTMDANGKATLPAGFLQVRSLIRNKCEVPQRIITSLDAGHDGYAVSGGELITSYPDGVLELRYYQALPTLVTNKVNWLLDSDPEIYIYALLQQVFLFKLDAERAKAAADYLGVLIGAKNSDDAAQRFLNTRYRIGGPVV